MFFDFDGDLKERKTRVIAGRHTRTELTTEEKTIITITK